MSDFETHSRALFEESIEGVDMPMRSRLTRARHAALEAAAASARRPWIFRMPKWTPAVGVSAAAVLGAALWFGSPLGNPGGATAEGASQFEVLDIVAASDENSGDAIEMLQDDLDFYDYADKAANAPPAA